MHSPIWHNWVEPQSAKRSALYAVMFNCTHTTHSNIATQYISFSRCTAPTRFQHTDQTTDGARDKKKM